MATGDIARSNVFRYCSQQCLQILLTSASLIKAPETLEAKLYRSKMGGGIQKCPLSGSNRCTSYLWALA